MALAIPDLQKILECPLCKTLLFEPVEMAACQHMYCFSCLVSMVHKMGPIDLGINCPMCRKFNIDLLVRTALPLQEIIDHMPVEEERLPMQRVFTGFQRAHGYMSSTSRASVVSVSYFARCWTERRDDVVELVRAKKVQDEATETIRTLVVSFDPNHTPFDSRIN